MSSHDEFKGYGGITSLISRKFYKILYKFYLFILLNYLISLEIGSSTVPPKFTRLNEFYTYV